MKRVDLKKTFYIGITKNLIMEDHNGCENFENLGVRINKEDG